MIVMGGKGKSDQYSMHYNMHIMILSMDVKIYFMQKAFFLFIISFASSCAKMEVHCTLCVALLDIDDKATKRMHTYNHTFVMLSVNKSPISGLKGHWTRGPARRSGAHRKWPVCFCVNTIIMFITVRAPTAVAPRAHVATWSEEGKEAPKGSPHTQQNCSKGCTSTQKHAETVYRCVQYSICIVCINLTLICINLFFMRNFVKVSSQIDNCTWHDQGPARVAHLVPETARRFMPQLHFRLQRFKGLIAPPNHTRSRTCQHENVDIS